MKRSFGSRPVGGMLKTFRRAVRAEDRKYSRSSSSTSSSLHNYQPLCLSKTTKVAYSCPLFISSASNTNSSNSIIEDDDDDDWVSVVEDSGDSDEDVFGSVPSKEEVLNAVSALQIVVDPTHYSQFFEDNRAYNLENMEAHENTSPTRLVSRVSSFGSESDWIEPSLHLCYPRMLERHGSIRVYDALHLLQSEPSIKRMVISLSSDKAVWDAVLNNEMVRELRDSMSEVESKVSENRDDNNNGPVGVTNILSWFYEKTKMKVIEIIEKIAELVNELFQVSEDEEIEAFTTGRTEEMLQISLMLSIMILLIVVVNRSHGT